MHTLELLNGRSVSEGAVLVDEEANRMIRVTAVGEENYLCRKVSRTPSGEYNEGAEAFMTPMNDETDWKHWVEVFPLEPIPFLVELENLDSDQD
jgi:hypothetical protein